MGELGEQESVKRSAGSTWQQLRKSGFRGAALVVGLALAGCGDSGRSSTTTAESAAADSARRVRSRDRSTARKPGLCGMGRRRARIDRTDADRGQRRSSSRRRNQPRAVSHAPRSLPHGCRWKGHASAGRTAAEPSSTSGSLDAEILKHWYIRKAELLTYG